MNPYRYMRESVRGKLIAIVFLTTTLVLLVSGTSILVHDLSVYRKSWAADVASEASILVLATAPALAFNDRDAAAKHLAALGTRPSIMAASLHDARGELYAEYRRAGEAAIAPTQADRSTVRISGERVEVVQPVAFNDEVLGTLQIRASYDVTGRVRTYLGMFSLIGLLSLGVAFVLSVLLQRWITVPLEDIGRVARRVVQGGDYSARVRQTTGDEIGLAVQALNRMLDEVQARSGALEASNDSLRLQIHERRRAEQALREADQRKDEFLATLAHELRNPLAPIRHAAKVLDHPQLDPAQQRWAREVIGRQVEHMALLLDDLLDVSRITRGRLELRREYSSLAHVVASALETARPLIESRHHALRVELPPVDLHLIVDPLRLAQALSNIIVNAAKYTDPGGTIVVTARRENPGVAIAVTDTGIGLSSESVESVFEMFSQVDGALGRSQGGLGIGLALVKGLVQLHGGTVEAASAGLGSGSKFTIHLPEDCVLAAPPAPGAAPRPEIAARGEGGLRILVADDNRDAAESLSILLRLNRHEVQTVHSGRDAIRAFEEQGPDVCILDIGMPDLNGYEVARHIRSRAGDRRTLLIALTGWGQQRDVSLALEAGFDRHFTKPVDAAELEDVLEERRNAHTH